MAKKLSAEEKIIKEIITDLTVEINHNQKNVYRKMSLILNRDIGPYNFNGIFGSKNNTFVDSVRSQFLDFESFFSSWMKGLNDQFEDEKETYLFYNQEIDWSAKSTFRMVNLLKDEDILAQVRIFLERNYYKYLDQRIRMKPDDSLWSIWFGYSMIYGLLIAPTYRVGNWTNDKSEIRKVDYNYWTIGHVLHTGLIDPELDEPYRFKTIDDFYLFYQSVIKRLSNSQYEKQITDLYIDYLKKSKDVYNEPFLIPEFRYKGLIRDHEHRLDFTVLNQHTSEFTGFEISPASSHMAVEKIKEKKQKTVNEGLKVKWEKEMVKRNKYFETFDITTITFTDSDLTNISGCFEKIKQKLEKRAVIKTSIQTQVDRLMNF